MPCRLHFAPSVFHGKKVRIYKGRQMVSDLANKEHIKNIMYNDAHEKSWQVHGEYVTLEHKTSLK